MGDYESKSFSNSVIFSSLSGQEIADLIISKLSEKDIIPDLHAKKWKLTYTRTRELDDAEKQSEVQPDFCKVQVQLLKVPGETN